MAPRLHIIALFIRSEINGHIFQSYNEHKHQEHKNKKGFKTYWALGSKQANTEPIPLTTGSRQQSTPSQQQSAVLLSSSQIPSLKYSG